MSTKKDKPDAGKLERLLNRKRINSLHNEGDIEDEDEGGRGGTGETDRLPKRKRGDSFLVEETWSMERKRRAIEQDGHRRIARVNAKERSEEEPSMSPEGELQNNILQHPWLDSPRFDGIDPALNPEPPLNSEARREYDNERREQEMEKQLRLGNMPKMSTAPKPRPQ